MTAAARDYGRRVVDIEQINPRNEAALRAWWEVGHAATADRPGKPWPLWEQSRVALPADNPERGVTLLGAIDGREMVGAGLLTRTAQGEPPLGDGLRLDASRPHPRGHRAPGRLRAGADRLGRRAYDDPERGLPPARRLGRRGAVRGRDGVRRREPRVDQGADAHRLRRPPRRPRGRGGRRRRLPDHHLRHRVPRRAPRVLRPPARHADGRGAARRAGPRGVRVEPRADPRGRAAAGRHRPARAHGDGDRPGRRGGRRLRRTRRRRRPRRTARSASRSSTRPTGATASGSR